MLDARHHTVSEISLDTVHQQTKHSRSSRRAECVRKIFETEDSNENRSSRAALRKRSAEALWRTERVVSWLSEELVRLGHDVTVFASGDSLTTARLIPSCKESLRLCPESIDHLAHHFVQMDQVLRHKDEFDLIHFHVDYLHFPMSRRERYTHVTTLHGRLDIPDLVPLYNVYSEMPVVSISDSQREPLPRLNWQGTVHHGMPIDSYKFHRKGGDYLAFLGRTSPEKGLDSAIEIAKAAGMPLKIAAKVDKADQDYFETVIQPLLGSADVEFIGEIGYPEKNEFLGNAAALLFPIAWPEPFGIVMIEAMACGTPVIAYPFGSVPEVIEDRCFRLSGIGFGGRRRGSQTDWQNRSQKSPETF